MIKADAADKYAESLTQSAAIIALHDAVNKIEATLNDGMKAMIAEHRIELKQIKGEFETIRTTVTGHVAKEDVLFQIFQKTARPRNRHRRHADGDLARRHRLAADASEPMD